MSVIGSNILAGASGQGGYFLTNSLRFRASASAYLNRTPSTGNRKTWTWSAWVKRGSSSFNTLFAARQPAPRQYIAFYNNQIYCYGTSAGSDFVECNTAAVFRDFSAWYHIVFVYDTTQATGSNRVKVYVNGVQQTLTFTTTPSQNSDGAINGNWLHYLGSQDSSTPDLDAYLAEVNFIDGQALTPSSFGETSATTGVWIPKKYSGSYGTNGFYLDFEDTSSTAALGYDAAGSNDWTVNNISLTAGSTYDSMTDVPTLTSATAANYAVLNPLNKIYSTFTLSNGNLSWTSSTVNMGAHGTLQLPTSGKYYWEIVMTANAGGSPAIGIADGLDTLGNKGIEYRTSGNKEQNGGVTGNGASAYGATWTTNDVIGVAYDADTSSGQITFYKNNSSQGVAFSSVQTNFPNGLFPSFQNNASGTTTFEANFGQRPFTYTPPTGFVRLNTFNLPTPTIGATASTQASAYMNNIIWTGNGTSTRTLTGLNFQPDFVWTKSRSNAYFHNLYDVVRSFGSGKSLHSNDTRAEGTLDYDFGYVSAVTSSGFSVANGVTNNAYVNENSATYVAWNWKANGAGVTNTAGSITSTVSANTTAGFSIVTYTGSGAAGTVGHGLGVAPSMIITKKRTNAGGGSSDTSWVVWHKSMTGAYSSTTAYAYLNFDSAAATTTNFYDGTAMTSSTFRWQTGNDNINYLNDTFVSYCFAEVAGYSAFGSYTGNGSSDGTFVYTGFRPRYVMIKNASASGNDWKVFDTARNTANPETLVLYPNLSNAEDTNTGIDFTANGFKLRDNGSSLNGSGNTLIYACFAETPFNYANAR